MRSNRSRPGRPGAKPRRWAERRDCCDAEMGESVTEGTVLVLHVAEGDAVAEGDTVEVSTDKIDAEVLRRPPARSQASVGPDDTVQVGQALAEMSAGAARLLAAPAALGRSGEAGAVSRPTTAAPPRRPPHRREGT
jgi:pyruvate/2-oxoglutarate dehydrogenase complex dihydrolipoamide acyltransferase (E2) component